MLNIKLDQRSSTDFYEARMKALYDGVKALLERRSNTIISFEEIRQRLGTSAESYRGIQAIKVEKIVGSENRYRDFSIAFRPKKLLSRTRWVRIDSAFKNMKDLPPIIVYEVGGVFFVRDGNHRVSVAKQQNIAYIDAEVYSLNSEISFDPKMSPRQMIEAIYLHDMNKFFKASGLPADTGNRELKFGKDERYDMLTADIELHLRYLRDEEKKVLTFPEASASWYRELFLPFSELADEMGAVSIRKKIYPADVYIWWIKYEQRIEQELHACSMPEDFLLEHVRG